MNEKEVKVLDIDKEKIEKKLLEIGAILVKDEIQKNVIYDSKERTLKTKHNAYLRIRVTKDLIKGNIIKTFTLKKNISNGNTRNNMEYETEVENEIELDKIIGYLGYDKKHVGSKHRKSYKHNDILFEIDTWDKDTFPNAYMEIEVNDENQIEEAVKLLNIDKSKITTKSIEELRKEINIL